MASSSSFSSEPQKLICGLGDWSLLPCDILVNIAGRLQTLRDFFSFRGVCSHWRSAASPSPFSLASQSPLLISYPNTTSVFDVVARRRYNLPLPIPSGHSVIAYSHGFLITGAHNDDDDDYDGCAGGGYKNIVLSELFAQNQIRLPEKSHGFGRIILSARPDSDECFVFQWNSYFDDDDDTSFQYLRVGDTHWTEVSAEELFPYHVFHMMFFDGQLLALNGDMDMLVVELEEDCLEVLSLGSYAIPGAISFTKAWLGESDGVIFSVGCYTQFQFEDEEQYESHEQDGGDDCGGHEFFVFLWNMEILEWEEIKDLGEKAVFVSDSGTAVMVSTRGGLGRLKKNCVYFTESYMDRLVEFSLKDKSSQVLKLSDVYLPGSLWIPPVWVFPNYC